MGDGVLAHQQHLCVGGEGEGVFRAHGQAGDGDAVAGEGDALGLQPLGCVGQGPILRLHALHAEADDGGAGFLTGDGGQMHDRGLAGGGPGDGGGALQLMEALGLQGDEILGAGDQIGEGHDAALQLALGGIAVGILADDGELALVHVGEHGDGHLGAGAVDGHGVDGLQVQIGVPVPDAEGDGGGQSQAGHGTQQLLPQPLFLFGDRGSGGCGECGGSLGLLSGSFLHGLLRGGFFFFCRGLLQLGQLHGNGRGDRQIDGLRSHHWRGSLMLDELIGGGQNVGSLGGDLLLGEGGYVGHVLIGAGHELPEGGLVLGGGGLCAVLLLSQKCVHQVDPVGFGGLLPGGGAVGSGFTAVFGSFLHYVRYFDGICGNFLHRFAVCDGIRAVFLHSGVGLFGRGRSLLHFDFRNSGFFGGVLHIVLVFCGFSGFLLHGFRLLRLGRGDGDVVRTVSLHIADEGVTHLCRGLPPVLGGVGAGLADDLGHLRVCADGGRDGLAAGQPVQPGLPLLRREGELPLVVDLVEHQTQCVSIHGGVEACIGIRHLRRSIDTAIPVRQGCIGQGIHGHEAQIADAVFLIAEEVDVLRLQVHIQPSGLPADSQGCAQVDAQVHCPQMGHGAAAGEPVQCLAVAAEQMDLVSDALLHFRNLEALVGDKAPLSGQLFQNTHFLTHALGQFLVVGTHCFCIPVDTGQQQGFHLDLGGGEGNLLYNIPFFRIVPHGRIAFHAAVVRNCLTQGIAVQQGG